MSPRSVRRLVLAVFVAGIGGMILGSILDNNGVAITFGLITAVAALGLILVTMVVPADAFSRPGDDRRVGSDGPVVHCRSVRGLGRHRGGRRPRRGAGRAPHGSRRRRRRRARARASPPSGSSRRDP